MKFPQFDYHSPPVPQQADGWNCGVYVLLFIEAIITKGIEVENIIKGKLFECFNDDVIVTKKRDIKTLIEKLHDTKLPITNKKNSGVSYVLLRNIDDT